MQLLSRPVNAAVVAFLLIAPSMAAASPVDPAYLDPVTHMQWAQLTDFPNTSRTTLLSLCTPICTGTLNGHDLTGWMLASNAQVETLVHDLLASNGLTDPGPGVVRAFPDWYTAANAAFAPNFGVGSTHVQSLGWIGYTFDGAGGISVTVVIGGGGSEQYFTFPRASDSMVCGTTSSMCGAWLIEVSSCAVNTVASFSNQQPLLSGTTATLNGNAVALNGMAATSNMLAGPAGSQSKSAGLRTLLNPAAFRRVRDDGLMLSPAGRRYAALYATHSPEVVRLVLTNSALRSAILNGLLLWQTNAAAIADRRTAMSSAALTVTADQARVVDEIANQLAKVGSSGLRKAIEEERHKQLPGFTLAQTVLRESGLAAVR